MTKKLWNQYLMWDFKQTLSAWLPWPERKLNQMINSYLIQLEMLSTKVHTRKMKIQTFPKKRSALLLLRGQKRSPASELRKLWALEKTYSRSKMNLTCQPHKVWIAQWEWRKNYHLALALVRLPLLFWTKINKIPKHCMSFENQKFTRSLISNMVTSAKLPSPLARRCV